MHSHAHNSGDAEVVSIDSFVREPNGVIIGVTLVKVNNSDAFMYVHGQSIQKIYSPNARACCMDYMLTGSVDE